MKKQESLIITQTDYEQLSKLISAVRPEIKEALEEELERASIVPDSKLPNDVVAMNSQVNFEDVNTGKQSTITLVYPHDADVEANKISILAPVGSALIGLRIGQIINWQLPHGKEKDLKVIAVTKPATK